MPQLPIHAVMNTLMGVLSDHHRAVLIAPPGAGKTTCVPLALLDQPWCESKKILVLEPRRLAARAAAERMASLLGERVGDTVGLRVRFETLVSARTRIEVITEGVFVRLLQADPEMRDVGAVLFDEFHERSLDTDLGLALLLDAQEALCPDVRLIVMSATLSGERVQSILTTDTHPHVPIIKSEGRQFPVDIHHIAREPLKRIEEQVCDVVCNALHSQTGSILVFLPGQGEITRVMHRLNERIGDQDVLIYPLYGTLERSAQHDAIAPAPLGKRKIVLATSIAETSLTIDGIRVVVDSGLARVPLYEPSVGVTRLETVRASKASADQRSGRSGRTQAGVCYRLWAQAAHGSLPDYSEPEIKQADLTTLMLTCAVWGVRDPQVLRFLDQPPAAALSEATTILRDIEAFDSQGLITDHGRMLLDFALPPRLAHMLIQARKMGWEEHAAYLAILIVERGLGGDHIDLDVRLNMLKKDHSQRAKNAIQMAQRWIKQLKNVRITKIHDERACTAVLLAFAYPQHVAMQRLGRVGEYQLANGRSVQLEAHATLAQHRFLCVAEISGRAETARMMSAASLSQDELYRHLSDMIIVRDDVFFDPSAHTVRGRRITQFKALVLQQQPLTVHASHNVALALMQGIRDVGLSKLAGYDDMHKMLQRHAFMHHHAPDEWSSISEPFLENTLNEWLLPFCGDKISLAEITQQDLRQACEAYVGYERIQKLNRCAPTHFIAPTQTSVKIDYSDPNKPTISIRVQELYGLKAHPHLLSPKIPLVICLLSPAYRPIQITHDLVSFWHGSWFDVCKDMKGRYPKHLWPDDPLNTAPTTRAKPRGS